MVWLRRYFLLPLEESCLGRGHRAVCPCRQVLTASPVSRQNFKSLTSKVPLSFYAGFASCSSSYDLPLELTASPE